MASGKLWDRKEVMVLTQAFDIRRTDWARYCAEQLRLAGYTRSRDAVRRKLRQLGLVDFDCEPRAPRANTGTAYSRSREYAEQIEINRALRRKIIGF